MAASRPQTVTLAISGPLERAALPGLLARAHALLDGGCVEVLCCDVSLLAADAVAIDALARLALAARRSGCRMRVRGACAELRDLVAFVGLGEVLRE
jgi:ABC-type transporter Mla MlaB component